jgi:hypothetical protein
MIKKTISRPNYVSDGMINYLNIVVKAHTEANEIGGTFVNWSAVTYSDFTSSVQSQIEYFYTNNIPYDISCTWDFINWAQSKTISGTPLLQWFLDKGCTLSTRAHQGSSKNASDAAYLLTSLGYSFNEILGTCDDLNDYVDSSGNSIDFYGTYYPAQKFKYKIIIGQPPRGDDGQPAHENESEFLASIHRAKNSGDTIVMAGGADPIIDTVPTVAGKVKNFEILTGVQMIMSNMGRMSDYSTRISNPSLRPNAGAGNYMHTPIITHGGGSVGANVTGGKPLADEVARIKTELDSLGVNYRFVSPLTLKTYWQNANEPMISYIVEDPDYV